MHGSTSRLALLVLASSMKPNVNSGFFSFAYGDGRYTCSNNSIVVAPSALNCSADVMLSACAGINIYSQSPDLSGVMRKYLPFSARIPSKTTAPSNTRKNLSTPSSAGPISAPSGIFTRHMLNSAPFICGEVRYAPEQWESHPGSPHQTRLSGVMTECDASCLLLVNPGSPSPRGLGFITSGYGIWADRLQGAFPFARKVARNRCRRGKMRWEKLITARRRCLGHTTDLGTKHDR